MSAYVWSAAGFALAATLIMGVWQTTGDAAAAGTDRPAISAEPSSVISTAPDGGDDLAAAWSAWAWQSSPRVTAIKWGRVLSCSLDPTSCLVIVEGWGVGCIFATDSNAEWYDCFTGYFD